MTSLPTLLGKVMAMLQADPLCKNVSVVETKEFSADQFFFKIRTDVIEKHKLQVRIYYNQGHIDYAYQLFTDEPLLRWDNKEEFSHLETYPHHHHDIEGHVNPSPLTGDPEMDVDVVLEAVSRFLEETKK